MLEADLRTFKMEFTKWLKFIILMAKNHSSKRQDHTFLLQRFAQSSKAQSVNVDFHPIQKNGSQSQQIIPKLNKDKNYFTPCFILEGDKKFWESCLSFEKLKFDQRLSSFNERKLQKSQPLVEPSSTYCQICKTHFASYFAHVNESEHRLNNSKSMGNQMIIDLCNEYMEKNKTKGIRKQTQRRGEAIQKESSRILRSFHRKRLGQQTGSVKNFSYVSTKINTSQVHLL